MREYVKAAVLSAGLLMAGASGGLAGEWREGVPSRSAHAFSTAAVLGDEIYVAGGASLTKPQSSFEVYDTVGDIWRSMPALPKGVQQAALAAMNGRLYLSGGYVEEGDGADNASFWLFDPSIGLWVAGPDMPAPRAWHRMVAANGKLYVVGGIGPGADRVFVFDTGTDSWSTLNSRLPEARSALATVLNGDELYVLGGRRTNGAPSDRVDILTLSSGTWRQGPRLPQPRAGIGAAVLNGAVHIVGGEQLSPPRTFDSHYVLAAGSSRWSEAEPMITPRHDVTALVAGGELFVVGGATGPGVYTVFTVSDLVSIYRP